MNAYLLIEGLDLAGKTTLCRALVDQLQPTPELRRNAFCSSNPLFGVADGLRRIGGLGEPHMGNLYAAALALDLRDFEVPTGLTIQESTIGLRSYCHYTARGRTELADTFRSLLDHDNFPRFDGCVVLTASLAARRERLKMRTKDAPTEIADDDRFVLVDPDTFSRMDEILVAECVRRYGAHVIDTSVLSANEVMSAVRSILKV